MSKTSPETLRQLIDYDPDTGQLTWKPRGVPHWDARFAGKNALNSPDKDGYFKGSVLAHAVKAHRVAWAIYHGEWPKIIDHINGDITDNRITNLRSIEERDSHRNMPKGRRNRSGVIGVDPRGRKWRAQITTDGHCRYLGTFETVEEAAAVRAKAQAELGFHQNHGREPRTSAA